MGGSPPQALATRWAGPVSTVLRQRVVLQHAHRHLALRRRAVSHVPGCVPCPISSQHWAPMAPGLVSPSPATLVWALAAPHGLQCGCGADDCCVTEYLCRTGHHGEGLGRRLCACVWGGFPGLSAADVCAELSKGKPIPASPERQLVQGSVAGPAAWHARTGPPSERLIVFHQPALAAQRIACCSRAEQLCRHPAEALGGPHAPPVSTPHPTVRLTTDKPWA